MNFRPCVTGRSLEYKLNRIGARTEPWGRPLRWGLQELVSFGGLNRHFKPYMRKLQIAIFRSVYHADVKFNRQLRPATYTSWVVSYGGKTISRWRTAAILKIVISPYLSKKSSYFDEILYTAAYLELDERHVIKNEKVALDRLRVGQNVFLVYHRSCLLIKLL